MASKKQVEKELRGLVCGLDVQEAIRCNMVYSDRDDPKTKEHLSQLWQLRGITRSGAMKVRGGFWDWPTAVRHMGKLVEERTTFPKPYLLVKSVLAKQLPELKDEMNEYGYEKS